MYNKLHSEIDRLNFENFIWIIFAILSILNISGDNEEKKYLRTSNKLYEIKANYIFEITIIFKCF